jgi:hypothetical protein
LNDEGRDLLDDVYDADLGSPFGIDGLEIVVEGIDAQLYCILIEDVHMGRLSRVAALHHYLEL